MQRPGTNTRTRGPIQGQGTKGEYHWEWQGGRPDGPRSWRTCMYVYGHVHARCSKSLSLSLPIYLFVHTVMCIWLCAESQNALREFNGMYKLPASTYMQASGSLARGHLKRFEVATGERSNGLHMCVCVCHVGNICTCH